MAAFDGVVTLAPARGPGRPKRPPSDPTDAVVAQEAVAEVIAADSPEKQQPVAITVATPTPSNAVSTVNPSSDASTSAAKSVKSAAKSVNTHQTYKYTWVNKVRSPWWPLCYTFGCSHLVFEHV